MPDSTGQSPLGDKSQKGGDTVSGPDEEATRSYLDGQIPGNGEQPSQDHNSSEDETRLFGSGSGAASKTEATGRAKGAACFGDYELLEPIAHGAMGMVYKARQKKLNRIVALKMILAGELASDEAVQRVHVEAGGGGAPDLAGIGPVYEGGESQGQQYFSQSLEGGG